MAKLQITEDQIISYLKGQQKTLHADLDKVNSLLDIFGDMVKQPKAAANKELAKAPGKRVGRPAKIRDVGK